MFAGICLFTRVGCAGVALFNEFEDSLDYMLSISINESFPGRAIGIPKINVTEISQNYINGIINLSNITFPLPNDIVSHVAFTHKNIGIGDALLLNEVIDFHSYGKEIGDF